MRIIDISQEVFSCRVYPGDPAPQVQTLSDMKRGDVYNLSAFAMCAHNGTHVDAPRHFLQNGKTIDVMPIEQFAGDCFVARESGDIDREKAQAILRRAQGVPRILIAGDITVTQEAADVFAAGDILLLGNESQSVGPEDAPMAVHLILLRANIALLEGIRLQNVPEGFYTLCAAPLNLGGCEGAPCRAILMTKE